MVYHLKDIMLNTGEREKKNLNRSCHISWRNYKLVQFYWRKMDNLY